MPTEATPTEPRTYIVGLPVTVRVHDDGTVDYSVDTSEAASAVSEVDEYMDIDPKMLEADVATIEHDPGVMWTEWATTPRMTAEQQAKQAAFLASLNRRLVPDPD